MLPLRCETLSADPWATSTARSPAEDATYFHYDARMQRFAIDWAGTLSYFMWDGMNQLVEKDASLSTVAEHTHGATPIEGIGSVIVTKRSSDYQYPHYDHRGSLFNLEDTGATDLVCEFNAFGEELRRTGSAVTRFGYQGTASMRLPVGSEIAGLFGTRILRPELGEFLSSDPLPLLLLRARPGVYETYLPFREVWGAGNYGPGGQAAVIPGPMGDLRRYYRPAVGRFAGWDPTDTLPAPEEEWGSYLEMVELLVDRMKLPVDFLSLARVMDRYAYCGSAPTGTVDIHGMYGFKEHIRQTRVACKTVGICPGCCDPIARGNMGTDDLHRKQLRKHYTINWPRKPTPSQRRKRAEVSNRWRDQRFADAKRLAKEGRCRRAMTVFGRVLHLVQDRYAHAKRVEGQLLPATGGIAKLFGEQRRTGMEKPKTPQGARAQRSSQNATDVWMMDFAWFVGCCCDSPMGPYHYGRPQKPGTKSLCRKKK